ncbi:MAG: hypothetical protein AAGG51_22695 [Cyanobacteria bacterium P01_G01_bin.54]
MGNRATTEWYLGLDWNGRGLAATLAQHPQGSLHPLVWHQDHHNHAPCHTRYPLQLSKCEPGTVESEMVERVNLESSGFSPTTTPLTLTQLYPHLRRALPFYHRRQQQWHPQIQLPLPGADGSDGSPCSLLTLRQGLQHVLQQVLPTVNPAVRAQRLSAMDFQAAIQDLAGIVVICPAAWGATYRFNLREALLETGLVTAPDQVLCVAGPLAIALAHQAQTLAAGEIVVRSRDRTALALYTDVAVTEVASWLESAADTDFLPHQSQSHGYNYGELARQEDLFYQLLYPQWLPHQDFLQAVDWPFPRIGAADFPDRDRATLALSRQAMGSHVLTLARQVLDILQHRPQVQAQLGQQPWQVTQTQLAETLLPGVTTALNTALNHLLSRQGQTSLQIRQLLWQPTAWQGLAPLLAPWLQRKFPQARLVAVTARVADGLALLPRFPASLNPQTHQYDDYFVLREVLQALERSTTVDDSPNPISLNQVCQRLRQRGFNAQDCRDRIAALLRGQAIPGLIPDAEDPWLSPESQAIVDYRALRAAALFTPHPERPGYFHWDARQRRRLLQYLDRLQLASRQSSQDPLLLPWQALEPAF